MVNRGNVCTSKTGTLVAMEQAYFLSGKKGQTKNGDTIDGWSKNIPMTLVLPASFR